MVRTSFILLTISVLQRISRAEKTNWTTIRIWPNIHLLIKHAYKSDNEWYAEPQMVFVKMLSDLLGPVVDWKSNCLHVWQDICFAYLYQVVELQTPNTGRELSCFHICLVLSIYSTFFKSTNSVKTEPLIQSCCWPAILISQPRIVNVCLTSLRKDKKTQPKVIVVLKPLFS